MIKNNKVVLIIVLQFLLLSCGFKPINQKIGEMINFQEITITGDKEIAYYLKNNILLISSDNSKNKYNATIAIVKHKTEKIKNTRGKITRYNLNLQASLNLKNLNNNTEINRTFSRNTDYEASSIHSETINNEKSALKNTIQKISDDIINFVSISVRDK
jgi:hypothetical protein|tara:strand:- start:281 stop:757 length:477 start_codon:yes stop_codon:yes gene_type:complete